LHKNKFFDYTRLLVRAARWHIFKPKIPIWINFGGFAMEDVGIFNGHLVYFTATWYILCLLGIIMVIWYIFPRFGTLNQEKFGNPAFNNVIYIIPSTYTKILCIATMLNVASLNAKT
jgi:hypothetical protein